MDQDTIVTTGLDFKFSEEIANIPGGENIRKCYACGGCTIGCPVYEIEERYNPRKIIRMVLLGMRNEVLNSDIIWLCANCYTCYERCPQNVQFTTISHAIKSIAIKEAKKGKVKKTPVYYFITAFLKSLQLHGRPLEAEVIFKLLLFRKDIKKAIAYMPLGIKMFTKGKLLLLPPRIKDRKTIRQIFNRAKLNH
jgi:heterodisulfide reductase subunit C